MINPYSRICNLIRNVRLLRPLMGGYFPALSYILKTRGKSDAKTTGRYQNIEFQFRRCDIPALREVLLEGEYAFLKEMLEGTNTPYIYDIGAHIGLFSIWAFSINPRAEILSIEASPHTYKILSSNVSKAQHKKFSWHTENKAAWHNNEDIKFSDSSESTMSHRVDGHGKVIVQGITLNNLIARLPKNQKIDLMKIDIEGAEEAFLCADGVNFEKIENLAVELHPQLCNTEKVMDVLKDNFTEIEECHNELLSKPLLFCRK